MMWVLQPPCMLWSVALQAELTRGVWTNLQDIKLKVYYKTLVKCDSLHVKCPSLHSCVRHLSPAGGSVLRVMRPLGSRALLVEVGHGGQSFEFLHFLSCVRFLFWDVREPMSPVVILPARGASTAGLPCGAGLNPFKWEIQWIPFQVASLSFLLSQGGWEMRLIQMSFTSLKGESSHTLV